jgi:hypothetical protein
VHLLQGNPACFLLGQMCRSKAAQLEQKRQAWAVCGQGIEREKESERKRERERKKAMDGTLRGVFGGGQVTTLDASAPQVGPLPPGRPAGTKNRLLPLRRVLLDGVIVWPSSMAAAPRVPQIAASSSSSVWVGCRCPLVGTQRSSSRGERAT